MDFQKQIDYWVISAEHDLDTAEALIRENKNDWALFLGHLVLEKILKAIIVKEKNEFPERTHNLIRLCNLANVALTTDDNVLFEQVNSFHMASRYPDEQFGFYKLCTREFTLENFSKIKEKYAWLKEKTKP
jgi:HEPN domain-containing protein